MDDDEGISTLASPLITNNKPTISQGNERETTTSEILEADSSSTWSYWCCHPEGCCLRYFALVLICFSSLGSSICYDNPAALMDHFHKDLNLGTTQFAMLYSVYSFPNVVSCFLGGFLIDRYLGIRLGTILYMLLILIGQILFATAVFFNSFPAMIVGRFLFGMGCESLVVCLTSYTVLWFKNKELTMVFGLQLSFVNIGSAVNFWFLEPLYSWVHSFYNYNKPQEVLGIVIFIVSTTCVFSFVCSLIMGYVDKRTARTLKRNQNCEAKLVKFDDIRRQSPMFWMICLIGLGYNVSTFTFTSMSKNFFIEKFKLNPFESDKVESLVFIISAVASPIFGIIIDKTGRNIYFILFAIIAEIVAHFIFVFSTLSPLLGMTIIGLSFSLLLGALSPLIALITPEHQIGTAYGICQSIQNLGMALTSLLVGVIVDAGGYFWLEIFFVICLTLSLLATLTVWSVDARREGILNMTSGDRNLRQKMLLINEGETTDNETEETEGLIGNCDLHVSNRFLPRMSVVLPRNYYKDGTDETRRYGSIS